VNVRDAERPGPTRFVRGGGGGRDELHIYRPDVREARAERAANADRFSSRNRDEHVQQESGRRPQPNADPNFGRRDGRRPERETLRTSPPSRSDLQPPQAQPPQQQQRSREIQRAFEPRPQVERSAAPSPRQERITMQRKENRPQPAGASFERGRQRSFERHDRPSPVQVQQAPQPRMQQPPRVQQQRMQQPQSEAQAARGQRRDLRKAQPAQQAPPAAIQPLGSQGNAYGNPHR
jgi:hypothetical protein